MSNASFQVCVNGKNCKSAVLHHPCTVLTAALLLSLWNAGQGKKVTQQWGSERVKAFKMSLNMTVLKSNILSWAWAVLVLMNPEEVEVFSLAKALPINTGYTDCSLQIKAIPWKPQLQHSLTSLISFFLFPRALDSWLSIPFMCCFWQQKFWSIISLQKEMLAQIAEKPSLVRSYWMCNSLAWAPLPWDCPSAQPQKAFPQQSSTNLQTGPAMPLHLALRYENTVLADRNLSPGIYRAM